MSYYVLLHCSGKKWKEGGREQEQADSFKQHKHQNQQIKSVAATFHEKVEPHMKPRYFLEPAAL